MNLGNDLKFFMDQSPVFWAAAASVGLGGTLLISAIYVWLRRRLADPRLRFRMPHRRSASTPADSHSIVVDETGYTLNGTASALRSEAAADPDPATAQRLEELLNRLRDAGDRLENALEIPSSTETAYSALKSVVQDVETETRVGVG